MKRWVVFSGHLKPSKIKGELPDTIEQYIDNDSIIPWHCTFTKDKTKAYLFDDFELNVANELANLWNMKVKRVDLN